MKICISGIQQVFDTQDNNINVLVMENPKMLFNTLIDIQNQIDGFEGSTVVANHEKMLDMSKSVELLTQVIDFDINKKALVSKVGSLMEKMASEPEYYKKTAETVAAVEKLLLDLSFEMMGDISFSKVNISSIIKSCGLEFNNDYEMLTEKLIDYMELVREYDRDKLFIFYNLRSIICDEEIEAFYDTCIRKRLNVFCIESNCRKKLVNENRYIIDRDLCDIIG